MPRGYVLHLLFFKNPFFISAWCLSDACSDGTSPLHPPLTHRPRSACGNLGLMRGGPLAPRTQVLSPVMPYFLPPDFSYMAALMPVEASQCLFLCTECLSSTHRPHICPAHHSPRSGPTPERGTPTGRKPQDPTADASCRCSSHAPPSGGRVRRCTYNKRGFMGTGASSP